MIPEAVVGMLACARIGAVHVVVFGGFGGIALGQRVEDAGAKVILTASCGVEGRGKVVGYQKMVRGAVGMVGGTGKVLVLEREEMGWEGGLKTGEGWEEVDWAEMVDKAEKRGRDVECVEMKSEDPLYVIYTSGTTGTPKGVLRENGGHAVACLLPTRAIAGIRGPGDVLLAVSDVGWVTGHSYLCYGPLLAGATTILFEGKPVGTPDAGVVWDMVERFKVNAIFTAPTALRAIRRADPELDYLQTIGKRGGLKSLRVLLLTGERSPPVLIETFGAMLKQYAADGAIMNDNWGLSEQGVPLTTTTLLPRLSINSTEDDFQPGEAISTPPGCAGKPMPGMDVHVVDDDGNEIPRGTMGNMVLGLPLSPSSFRSLWKNDERFYTSHLKRFEGKWFDTGDAGMMDEEGFIQIMSRSDDVINVSGHRLLSTGAIEQSIAVHTNVAECCVIGLPDQLKGHVPFVFVVTCKPLKSSEEESTFFRELNQLIRDQQGSISALGGMLAAKQGDNLIPKTRSGKMLRRNLRELIDHAENGEIETGKVNVPATIEDPEAVNVARRAIREYYVKIGKNPDGGKKIKARM